MTPMVGNPFSNEFNIIMNVISKMVRSRTVWTIAIMFILAGFEGVRDIIPVAFQTPLFGLLGLLTAYFRMDAKVDFKGE